jgi:23S rRNA pseudouridine1911/1915/1917 synthase
VQSVRQKERRNNVQSSAYSFGEFIVEPDVVFEDQFILVLNKPAGWIVNKSATTQKQKTIQDWLSKNYNYQIAKSKSHRGGLAHRLDKETSGLLIVAKDSKSLSNIQAQFKTRTVKKEYISLVHGIVDIKEGEIKAPTGRLPWAKRRFGVVVGGRKAVTYYKVISYYKLKERLLKRQPRSISDSIIYYSLLSVFPHTGRTHQIRIHFKSIGHPVVSDELYAGRKTSKLDRKWCPRLFLHAAKITFTHPDKKKKQNFQSNLPTDLKDSLKALSLHKTKA